MHSVLYLVAAFLELDEVFSPTALKLLPALFPGSAANVRDMHELHGHELIAFVLRAPSFKITIDVIEVTLARACGRLHLPLKATPHRLCLS